MNLAQWCSPAFAVAVSKWVFELMTTGRVELAPAKRKPYSERIDRTILRHRAAIQGKYGPGFWSVFSATVADLPILEDVLENHLLPAKDSDLPDGSIGLCWATYRRKCLSPQTEPVRAVDIEIPGRGIYQPLIYQPDELGSFHQWLCGIYFPEKLGGYWQRKFGKSYGQLPPASAADHASRQLSGRPAVLPPATRRAISLSNGPIRADGLLESKQPTLFVLN